MSRVGRLPVQIPAGVTVVVDEGWVKVKGPKGELKSHVLAGTEVAVEGAEARVTSERQRRNPAFARAARISRTWCRRDRRLQQDARNRRHRLSRQHGR
jgi:ribosomal protein L6P/L9E